MATEFQELPIIDLCPLSSTSSGASFTIDRPDVQKLTSQLREAFETVGFAYLVNLPLSYTHDDVFRMTRKFFAISEAEKLTVAKKTFRKQNENTYRGYFPAQPGKDNYKEGFELGLPNRTSNTPTSEKKFNLTEPNVFPPESETFPASLRKDMENLYTELDSLSRKLLTLLAVALGKQPDSFDPLVADSISTLRFLHYPTIARSRWNSDISTSTAPKENQEEQDKLSCGAHTDSGLLTLLHQDTTGGLEVLNAAGKWIPAPYVPASIVVNIGDLMAELSSDKFVATQHRVRRTAEWKARYSVPFFFEPGVDAVVTMKGKEMRYEEFVLGKMATWIEFQDVKDEEDE